MKFSYKPLCAYIMYVCASVFKESHTHTHMEGVLKVVGMAHFLKSDEISKDMAKMFCL